MYDQNDILGVGPRWNIIHWMVKVGAEEPQLLEDQLDMWIAKKCTGDYHQEYQKNVNKASWHTILERVCKHCYEKGWKCDIKLDNARYHKDPLPDQLTRTKVRKMKVADLKKWLDDNDVAYPHDWLKEQLLIEVLRRLPEPKYKAEVIAEKYGHRIHWTPPYHPELQPIETVWAWCKNYVRKVNKKKNMKEVGEQVKTGFTRIKRSSLGKLVRRVERFELKYYRALMDNPNVLWLSRSMFDEPESSDNENSNAEIDPSAQESSDLESESEIANEEDSD